MASVKRYDITVIFPDWYAYHDTRNHLPPELFNLDADPFELPSHRGYAVIEVRPERRQGTPAQRDEKD